MLQAGRYFGRLQSWTTTQSGQKKTPTVALEFEIDNEAVDGQWRPITPTKRTVYVYLSDAAWDISIDKLNALGFNGDFGLGMNFGDGAKADGVELQCKIDEYEGNPREKWELTNWGGGFDHEPAPEGVIRQLNAKWKNAASAKPTGKPSSPSRPVASAPIEKASIPF